ncbi:LrgB family protein [Ruminococcus sp. OA3]|uniref:LrgB family protein n=1 Tax=Ruminococcus sp. OA3 TaxID=2914164 RepID=UPI001F06AFCF|nr:LrgB family protein [Ruminococcus sp. OA3]MCH1983917.1 LrgB family protein [Ruminococcus sp. OA3]
MSSVFTDSVYFGFFLSLITYFAGVKIKQKFKFSIFNPLLISIIIIIAILCAANIPYEDFNRGADYLTYLLTPATVCLALPLYRQIRIIREYWIAVTCGLIAGCAATMLLVIGMCSMLRIDETLCRSLLPKSITTAIAIGISEEIGGISPVTVAAVIITGVIGAIVASLVFRLFHIKNPVAQGLALGASAHAIGTTKALELGEVQGAMSSLAIVVSGILTVITAPVVAGMLGT